MDYVIELNNVTKRYDEFALDNVSFRVPKGCICGFIGQNGAGKSTTIKLIMDIIRRDDGDIRVFGEDMRTNGPKLKERIGIVFDEMGFHDFLTAKQLSKVMKGIYQKWDEETFFRYLKRFGLPTKKPCGTFSRGMRMKLQIAVAMSHGAELLVMDEPTSGLDPIVRNEILEIFQEYVMDESHTILLSSHITGDLERIADEVVFIDKGRIVLAGNKDEMLENHALVKCGKEEATQLVGDDVIARKDYGFGAELLVKNPQVWRERYPELVIEPSTLEEIMIFYVSRANAQHLAEQSEE